MTEDGGSTDIVDVRQAVKLPAKFPFPFPPYDIQQEFMTALFGALNEGKMLRFFNSKFL